MHVWKGLCYNVPPVRSLKKARMRVASMNVYCRKLICIYAQYHQMTITNHGYSVTMT